MSNFGTKFNYYYQFMLSLSEKDALVEMLGQ